MNPRAAVATSVRRARHLPGPGRRETFHLAIVVQVLLAHALAAGLAPGSEPASPVVDAPAPFLSWRNGLASSDPLLQGGKMDFIYRYTEAQHQYNAFGWTPLFKAGFGVLRDIAGGTTNYGGGYIRPFAAWPEAGDLLLGALAVSTETRTDFEYQGEYRFPFGLGLGAGAVEREVGPDVNFEKITFRRRWGEWSSIVELQRQELARKVSPGGYIALSDERFMGVYGNDGEQWRAAGGFVTPESKGMFRPAAELLYVDNSIGAINGPRVFFGNATLRMQGGFLSHAGRLGRAMGPQGLEYGNPLGFLSPTWNRRIDLWEMGTLADFRMEIFHFPNHTQQENYELIVFPFQFDRTSNLLDFIFVGGSYFKTPGTESPGIEGGITGAVGFLKASIGVRHDFDPARTVLTVGLIDSF